MSANATTVGPTGRERIAPGDPLANPDELPLNWGQSYRANPSADEGQRRAWSPAVSGRAYGED